jgi:hypothetical protein
MLLARLQSRLPFSSPRTTVQQLMAVPRIATFIRAPVRCVHVARAAATPASLDRAGSTRRSRAAGEPPVEARRRCEPGGAADARAGAVDGPDPLVRGRRQFRAQPGRRASLDRVPGGSVRTARQRWLLDLRDARPARFEVASRAGPVSRPLGTAGASGSLRVAARHEFALRAYALAPCADRAGRHRAARRSRSREPRERRTRGCPQVHRRAFRPSCDVPLWERRDATRSDARLRGRSNAVASRARGGHRRAQRRAPSIPSPSPGPRVRSRSAPGVL